MTASMQMLLRSEAAFYEACVTIRPQCWLSPVGAVGNTAIWIQGEWLHFASSSSVPHSSSCVCTLVRIADQNPGGSAGSQGGSASNATSDSAEHEKRDEKQESKPAKKNSNELGFTAEQVVESVILVYGTRPALEHIRRNGMERGKITRTDNEGKTEESEYERRFIRGENLDKDKIRLDQKLPTMEYSLIFGEGKLWGLINGAAFTPRQDATTNFISQHHHSIDSLLRYKECGSTLTLVGKDQQKGLDLFVVDLIDKEKRKTRYYISANSLRVLWLEYEEGNPGRRAREIHAKIPRLSGSSTDSRALPHRVLKTDVRARKLAF